MVRVEGAAWEFRVNADADLGGGEMTINNREGLIKYI